MIIASSSKVFQIFQADIDFCTAVQSDTNQLYLPDNKNLSVLMKTFTMFSVTCYGCLVVTNLIHAG